MIGVFSKKVSTIHGNSPILVEDPPMILVAVLVMLWICSEYSLQAIWFINKKCMF